MTIPNLLNRINTTLHITFDEVETWFDRPAPLRTHRPKNGGWTIDEVLEHIVLTSHFLLILIDKGTKKALKNTQNRDLEAELTDYKFETEGLNEVGISQSFEWIRPEHMEPTGNKSLTEIREELNVQRKRCEEYLAQLKGGEGVLYKTTMSVNNLGKINVYQYIYFLIQHAKRHLQQMERIEKEFPG